MLVGWVLQGWRMGEVGLAVVVHPVLRSVLLVEMAQTYHFEAEGEPSKRGLALQLRLQMGFDAAGCWVAAAVHLMLQLELTVKSSQEQHCEAKLWREQPRQRSLAMVLHRQKETDASDCWLEGCLTQCWLARQRRFGVDVRMAGHLSQAISAM